MYRLAIASITCALTTTAMLGCSEDSKTEESEQGAGGASEGDSGAGGAAATGGVPSGGAASGGASTSSGGAGASGGATTGDSGSSGGASPAPEGGVGDTLGSCTGVTVGQCSEYVHDSESTVPRGDQHDGAEADCTTDGGTWSESGCTRARGTRPEPRAVEPSPRPAEVRGSGTLLASSTAQAGRRDRQGAGP